MKGVKRRRDADQRILDQFWHIGDPKPAKRFNSLQTIIGLLMKNNEANDSNDMMYCLDRIIRGMASARQFVRHGFCVLLTQILSDFQSKISLESILTLSEKYLGKVNEVSNHDSVIGWSLVIASILQSDRLSDADEETLRTTFDVLYTLGLKKQYIELVMCQLMEEFVQVLSNKEGLVEKIILNRIKKDLIQNQSQIYFAYICLLILDKFPKLSDKSKLSLKYISKEKNFETLSVMIKESTAYQPSVHPFHPRVIKYFMNSEEQNFTKFWNHCVNDILFGPNNTDKGLLGFEIIKMALNYIDDVRNVSPIISPEFVRTFIQALSVQSHPLHIAAIQTSQIMIDSVRKLENSEIQLEIVNCFTNPPGSLLFDDISKSKFFTNLLQNLTNTSKNKWTQNLRELFVSTDKIDSNDMLRIRCIQQISSVCKSITSNDDIDILWLNTKFLFCHSYFEINSEDRTDNEIFTKPIFPISERLRQVLKDGFRSVLNHSLHLGSKTTKEKFLCEVNSLQSMVKFINDIVSNESFVCLADSKFLEPFHQIVKKISKLKKKLKSSPSNENEIRVFILFYSIFCIQLFDDSDGVINILPDLNECMKRAILSHGSTDASDAPEWADVLIDLILSLLTTTSKFTANILFSGFKHICHLMTSTGLQSLIDAINPSNDQQLFANDDASDDDDDQDMEQENNSQEDQESDASENETESEEDDENQDIDEKFRNEVMSALGPAAQNDDDEESIYLTDNEMFEIDESLANVFRAKFSDKKKASEKQQSILTFRTRCLDLIEIFLSDKSINLDQVFQLIGPLVALVKSLVQSPKQNQLSTKAIHVISQISKYKDIDNTSLDLDSFKSTFDNLVSLMSKAQNPKFQNALHSLLIWIISLTKKLHPNDDWYMPIIRAALKTFFDKNNCQITAHFFKSLIEAHKDIGLELLDVFLNYAFDEDIRPFQKSNAVEMLLFSCKGKSIDREKLVEIRDKTLEVLCNEFSNEPMRAQYVNELFKLFDSADKELKMDKNELMNNRFALELSSKLKSLTRKQKRKLSNIKSVIRRIASLNI